MLSLVENFTKFRIMKRTNETRRTFSTSFKKEKVSLLDDGKITVRELSEIYEVSPTAIYKWLGKYSKIDKQERVVVEKKSEARKNIELLHKIRDMEQALGKKQLELDYYKEVLETLKEQEGEDVEKKYRPRS